MNSITNTRPQTCKEALAAWDAGGPVTSVSMGGIGPSYEQCIQTLAFELLRALLAAGLTFPDPIPAKGSPEDKACRAAWDAVTDPVISRLNETPWGGFSGAQVGAACNLAGVMLRRGYAEAIASVPTSRLILVGPAPGFNPEAT